MSKNKKKIEKQPATSMKGSSLWGLFLFFALIFVDQITKIFAEVYFNLDGARESIELIPGWIEFTLTYNRGISYGMGDDAAQWVKLLVIGATAVLMVAFAIFYFLADKRRSWLRTAIVFIVAGGVGNLIDRVYFRVWDPSTLLGVRDMVDLSRFGFAVCNFADFFITGGAVALVLAILFFDRDALFPVGKYKKMAKEYEPAAAKKNKAETRDE